MVDAERKINRIFRRISRGCNRVPVNHGAFEIANCGRPGIEGRVRERARVRLEWDDVWDGTVVPAKVVRRPTVSARRSKTRRTGCHRAGLSSFSARRSSFCAARVPRGVKYREHSFIPAYFQAHTLEEGANATLKTIARILNSLISRYIEIIFVVIACANIIMFVDAFLSTQYIGFMIN